MVTTIMRMGCRCCVLVALVGACKGGDTGTGTSTTGESSTSGTSTGTGSSGEATSTTGMPTTGTSNAVTEAGENGPPCPRGEILPEELPSGVVGEPYMATITHNISSAGTAFVDGMLPPGIMATEGEDTIGLAGTPTMAGEFPIIIMSYTGDGGTCLPDKNYVLVIEDGGTSSSGSTGTGTGTTG